MTQQELDAFFKRAFVAFPNVEQWVSQLPDGAGTLGTWRITLARTDAIDANTVLNKWIEGTLADPPLGYKIPVFAQEVRMAAERLKIARSKESALDDHRTKANIQPRNPNHFSHTPYMAQIFEIADRYHRSEITLEECDRLQQAIVGEFNRAIDEHERKRVKAYS